jgi:hypothetical protein
MSVDDRRIRVGIADAHVVAAERRAEITTGGPLILQRPVQQIAVALLVVIAARPAAGGAARLRPDVRHDRQRRRVG